MRIIKKAIQIGNGAAVYIPREFSGKQITIIIPEKVQDIKRTVAERLLGYLDNIVGVYLFGSYARGEQGADSDVDILIITKSKSKEIKHLFPDIDTRILTLNQLKKSISTLPALILPILKEAKTIINPELLEEIQKEPIDYKKFKWNFDEIKQTIKTIQAFIDFDEEDISISNLYSLVMRARICYMIQTLIKNIKFSNSGLRAELSKRGLPERKYDEYCSIYRKVRENQELKGKIKKQEIEFFMKIIQKYCLDLENETKKEIKKRN